MVGFLSLAAAGQIVFIKGADRKQIKTMNQKGKLRPSYKIQL
jgi:hypothetical protein